MEVYIDSLIFENILINGLILFATGKILRYNTKMWKILLGASIGAVYAVLMLFLPGISLFYTSACKMLLSVLIVAVTYTPKRIKPFFKALVCFYFVTFVFAGLALAVLMVWGQSSFQKNGVFYFSWVSPVKYFIPVVILGYALVKLFLEIIRRRASEGTELVDLYISFDGNGRWMPALVDTGNELRDPLSGAPVVIVEIRELIGILPENIRNALADKGSDDIAKVQCELQAAGWLNRFRLVPYKSLGCDNGMMPGLKPDYIEISGGGRDEKLETKEVIVCFYNSKLSEENNYHALLGPDLVA